MLTPVSFALPLAALTLMAHLRNHGFETKVEKALATVRKVLDNTKRPQLAENVSCLPPNQPPDCFYPGVAQLRRQIFVGRVFEQHCALLAVYVPVSDGPLSRTSLKARPVGSRAIGSAEFQVLHTLRTTVARNSEVTNCRFRNLLSCLLLIISNYL